MLVNLTPHVVRVLLPDQTIREYAPSGTVARVDSTERPAESIHGIPCTARTLTSCRLPELEADEMAIVSSLVLEAAGQSDHPLRHRLVVPDTGSTAVRQDGQVVAVTRFVRAD